MSESPDPPSYPGTTRENPSIGGKRLEGARDASEDPSRAKLREMMGLAILVALILFFCLMTVVCAVYWIGWLSEATPTERIDRMGQILIALVTALAGSISTLMWFFFRRHR